jgi:hypothetical protein
MRASRCASLCEAPWYPGNQRVEHFNQKPRRKAEFIRPLNLVRSKAAMAGFRRPPDQSPGYGVTGRRDGSIHPAIRGATFFRSAPHAAQALALRVVRGHPWSRGVESSRNSLDTFHVSTIIEVWNHRD